MNRQDALTAGLITYDPGKPCRNGHTSPRYAKTGHCVACLRDARANAARLQNTGMAARAEGSSLFAYKLHPDDHASALAFCQALDLQRGRLPASQSALGAPQGDGTPQAVAMPAWLAERRRQLEGAAPPARPPQVGEDEPPAPAAPYLPGEFARFDK